MFYIETLSSYIVIVREKGTINNDPIEVDFRDSTAKTLTKKYALSVFREVCIRTLEDSNMKMPGCVCEESENVPKLNDTLVGKTYSYRRDPQHNFYYF